MIQKETAGGTESRLEKDSIGSKEIPESVYYGVQSLRAAENFHITGLSMHPEIINSLAQIKKAAAITNCEVGLLDKKRADAIVQACDEIAGGALLAGMAGEYALSAILSLGVLKKRTGRLCSGVFLLRLLAAAGGAVLAGLLIRSVCFRFFGFFPALVLTFLLLAAAEAMLFGLLGLIRPGTLAGLLRRRRNQAAKLP